MPKREVTMNNWNIGFRKIISGFIVCLEGTPLSHPHMNAEPIWTSSVVRRFIDKGIIETKNTIYHVCGKPKEFYTKRAKDKYGRNIFLDSDGKKIGTAYNFGSKCWWFKSKYYKSLWACQLAADFLVIGRKVKELNNANR